MCVCVSVCVEALSHALTMLHCPLNCNSNLCKDSFSSSHPSLLLLSLFFLQCGLLSSGLSRPPLPPSCTVRLCPSFALSLPLSLLHASLPPSAFFFSSPHCRPVLISISSSYTLRSLSVSLLSAVHTMLSLDSFILCLVSCPPPLGWTDTSCKKVRKKEQILQPLSHLLCLSLPFVPPVV